MRDDDDRDDEDYKRSSHGADKSRPHGSKVDDSPDFNSTALDKEGKLFGVLDIKDPGVRSQINTFYPAMLTWASQAAEDMVAPIAEKMARQAGKSEAQVMAASHTARNVAGYSVIFLKQGLELTSNVFQAGKTTAELSRALKPLGKEGWECETVQTVKRRTSSIFMQNLMRTATGLVSTLPALYTKGQKGAAEREKRMRQREWEEAKASNDPEKLAALLEKESATKHGLDPALERKALDISIEKQEKEYLVRFEEFKKSAKANEVRKQFKEDFKLPVKVDEVTNSTLERLKDRYGIDTSRVSRRLDDAKYPTVYYDNQGNQRPTKTPQNRQAIWDDFKKEFERGSRKKDLEETAVRSAFVKREGAWDRTWEDAYYFGTDKNFRDKERIPTRVDEIRKKFDERVKASHEAEKTHKTDKAHGGKDGEPSQVASMAAGIGAGVVSEMLGNLFGGKEAMEKYSKPTAWDYIDALKKLQREALKNGENLPEEVDLDDKLAGSLRDEARRRGETVPKGKMSYALVVHEIIQRNETERGRAPIHKHEFQHLADAEWDSKKIKEIPETELSAYELAVTRMANLVETGQLSAIALNLLVGNRKYKITSVLKDKDENAKKAVEERIEKVMKNYRLRDDVNAEKATQARGSIIPTDAEIRAAFGPGGLKGDQRAFTFGLLEAVVQNKKKLCEITGMSTEQCDKLGGECRARFNTLLDAAVLDLAERIDKDPEALAEKLKLTDGDKEVITSLAKGIEEQHKTVTDLAANREDLKTAETAVVNAVTALGGVQKDKGPGFWQGVMERFEGLKNPKKKAAKAEKDEGDEMGEEEKEPKFSDRLKKERGKEKPSLSGEEDDDLGFDDAKGIDDDRDEEPASGWAKNERAGSMLSKKPGRHGSPAKEAMDSFTPGGLAG